MILIIDTETTGKADFRSPPDAPHQPRLVQFAALLIDENWDERQSANLVIKPDGFTIPREASEIHGITTEIANEIGVDCATARHVFRRWWACSDLVVAHNIDFDMLIMDGEMDRHFKGKPWGERRELFCTMKAMTPVCMLPGQYDDFKWPKLQEAFKHAFGREFDGAHDALADVRACALIYQWLMAKREAAKEEVPS